MELYINTNWTGWCSLCCRSRSRVFFRALCTSYRSASFITKNAAQSRTSASKSLTLSSLVLRLLQALLPFDTRVCQ